MIEIKCNQGVRDAEISGTVIDLLADVTCIVNCVYEAIKEENEKAAEFFKTAFIATASDAFMSREDISKEIGKIAERISDIEDEDDENEGIGLVS